MLLHQHLVFGLDGFERRVGAEPHHLQRFTLRVEDLARLGFGLGPRPGARPPPSAAIEFAEHAEGIGRAVEIDRVGLAFATGAVGAHLPGRTVAGQRILLVTRDRLRIHALEEIVGLVVSADMIEAKMEIPTFVAAAFRRAV